MLDTNIITIPGTRNGLAMTLGDDLRSDLRSSGGIYHCPQDLLSNHRMSAAEKRMLLASWASDACAVESRPWLRQPPEMMGPVLLDDILDALKRLDLAS